MVCELMPYSGGLTRNIVQCLEDFNIPLKLSHTVVNIHGKDRLEGVTIAAVDENLQPIEGSEEYVECDTLLLSVGLIPENELSRGVGIALDPVTSGPVVDETMATSVEESMPAATWSMFMIWWIMLPGKRNCRISCSGIYKKQ